MTCSACRSSWIFVSTLWLASWAAQAQTALEVRPAGREIVSSEPRQVVSTAFTVRNTTAAPMEVDTSLELPGGWEPVTPAMPLALAPGESSLRLVSFTIPEGARAGTYPVSFAARDRLLPANAGAASVQVRVLPAERFNLAVLEAPDIAVSGERIAAGMILRNGGNVPLTVNYRVTGRHMARLTPATGVVRVEPAESRRIDLDIEVDEIHERVTGRITVSASIDGTATNETVGCLVQLVPRARRLDALRTVPSRMEARWVARDSRDGRTVGWQPALSGGGVLDESRGDLLRYSLRGPDRRQSGSFGASEEYWLRYDSKHVAAGAGDLTYALTPLTEPGRLGRGATIAYSQPTWSVGGFGMRDAFGSGTSDQAGASALVRPTSTTELGLSFLDRSALGQIVSLRAQRDRSAGAALDVDVELARSRSHDSNGHALRFAMLGEHKDLSYYASGWSADETFAGALRDKVYLSAGFDLAKPGGWTWRGYYRLQDWNLTPLEEIEPDLRDSTSETQRMRALPEEQQAGLGAGHRLGKHLSATLDYVVRHRDGRDGMAEVPALPEQQSGSWRGGLNAAWKSLSLQYTRERGRAEARSVGRKFETSMEMLAASWRVGWLSCGAYLTRDEQSDLDSTEPRRTTRGINASLSHGAFALNIDTQRSDSRFGLSTLSAMTMVHQAESGARWSLAARRMTGRFERSDYLLSYSLPIRVPIMPRRGMSEVRGRVFDAQTQAGLRNVVLRLDGRAAVTDQRGEFRFPAVSAGTHPITVEQAAMEIDQVPASGAPREVELSAGRPAQVLIPMMRSAQIGVRVVVREPRETATRPVAGALVSFRNGDSILRRLTDATGEARVGGVPAGTWIVAVDEATLPAGFRPAQEEWRVEAVPGGKLLLEILLSPEQRRLRMQPPLAVR